jgi:hypothetical protein
VELLKQNPDKIDWYNLSIKPSIFEIDYEVKERTAVFKEELVMVGSSPKIIMRLLDMGIDIEDLVEDFVKSL